MSKTTKWPSVLHSSGVCCLAQDGARRVVSVPERLHYACTSNQWPVPPEHWWETTRLFPITSLSLITSNHGLRPSNWPVTKAKPLPEV